MTSSWKDVEQNESWRKKKINTIMRYYYIPIRRTKTKKKKSRGMTVSYSGKGVAHLEYSY